MRISDLAAAQQIYQIQDSMFGAYQSDKSNESSTLQQQPWYDDVSISSAAMAKSENSQKINQMDRSLASLESGLKDARALGELASSANISDEFRAQLETEMDKTLSAIDEAIENDFGGENPTGIELSGDTFAESFNVSTQTGAAEATTAMASGIDQIQSMRQAIYAPPAESNTYNIQSDLDNGSQLGALEALGGGLTELRNVAELATNENISDEFRAELNAEAERIVGDIEDMAADAGVTLTNLDSADTTEESASLAASLDLGTIAQAEESLTNINQVLDRVSNEVGALREMERGQASAASQTTPDEEEVLNELFFRYGLEWETQSNTVNTLMSSMAQSTSTQQSLFSFLR